MELINKLQPFSLHEKQQRYLIQRFIQIHWISTNYFKKYVQLPRIYLKTEDTEIAKIKPQTEAVSEQERQHKYNRNAMHINAEDILEFENCEGKCIVHCVLNKTNREVSVFKLI